MAPEICNSGCLCYVFAMKMQEDISGGLTGCCRDCGAAVAIGQRICGSCGSTRLLRHSELGTLSIAHVDCDAFFAAVEKRDNPALADKPVIVGGGRRGVVSTCCYIARTYGVRSAMPMFKALALCPDAVVVRSNFDKYREAAGLIRDEMDMLTPLVQPISIDEAFLDLSGTGRLHGAPPAISLVHLARRIEARVGITVSIGLSHNKFLAKIASDLDKPRGFAVIGEAETVSFLAAQPVTAIWGVGDSFAAKLARDGYQLIGDLQGEDPRLLARRYGDHGLRLARLARGEDARPVRTSREVKSISNETTFSDNLRDRASLEDILWLLSEKVSLRAKEKKLAGRVITLKLKNADFRSLTRRETVSDPTNLAGVIFDTGRKLLTGHIPTPVAREAYRLIGIGLSDLYPADRAGQAGLFGNPHEKLAAREKAIDTLRAKFGSETIATGRGLQAREKRRTRSDDQSD